MGSYAHLYVGALKFDWAKNGTSRWVVHLFRSGDRRVAQARSVPVPRAVMRDYEGERFEPTADFPAVYYQTSVGVLGVAPEKPDTFSVGVKSAKLPW